MSISVCVQKIDSQKTCSSHYVEVILSNEQSTTHCNLQDSHVQRYWIGVCLYIFLKIFCSTGVLRATPPANQNVFGKEKHKFANTGINYTRGHLGGGTIISNLN